MLENILEWYYSTRLFQSRKQPLLHTCALSLEAIFEKYRICWDDTIYPLPQFAAKSWSQKFNQVSGLVVLLRPHMLRNKKAPEEILYLLCGAIRDPAGYEFKLNWEI
jgi:hypothetical protein